MKKSNLSTTTDNATTDYKRNNTMQVNKVRCFIRKSEYLLEPNLVKRHMSIDNTTSMSTDLVTYSVIAVNNIKNYIKSKVNNMPIQISPVYVTEQEQEEANRIENKSIKDLQILIYQKMETLENSHVVGYLGQKNCQESTPIPAISVFHHYFLPFILLIKI